MKGKPNSTRYHVKSSLWIAILAFPTGLIFCPSCLYEPISFLKIGSYSSVLWVLMWKGNEGVSNLLDRKLHWDREPLKRLISGVLGHLIYTILAMFLINYATYLLYGWNEDAISFKGMVTYSIPALIITFLIASFLTARGFFITWRQTAINEERMKKEVVISKFEALKNQVNPHFLFNSLNVLTSLVYKDPDLSAKFIKKLSDVYRYVLEVQDKELVDLKEEVDFLQSFTFLLKMRHDKGLQVHIDLPKNGNYKVAPLALQMLVENAVKHNVISSQTPLSIRVLSENGYLVVRNNLQKKEIIKSASPSVGLQNIKDRYAFFSDLPVIVNESTDTYEVKLPLLKLKK